MDNESMDFDAFFSAFGDTGEDGGNQTDTEQEAPEQEDTVQETDSGTEDGESSGEESTPDQEKKPGDGEEAAQGANEPPQKFTIKVNKQTREVELPEMTELAQKGADYDRVKGQVEERENTISDLQGKLDKQQAILDVLQMIAGKDGGDCCGCGNTCAYYGGGCVSLPQSGVGACLGVYLPRRAFGFVCGCQRKDNRNRRQTFVVYPVLCVSAP